MWLKAVLMEDRRPKLKAGRGGPPYPRPPQNTIILQSPTEEKLFLVLKPDFGTLFLTLKSRKSQIVLHKKSLLTKGEACHGGHCVPQEQFLTPVPGTPLLVPHKRTKTPTQHRTGWGRRRQALRQHDPRRALVFLFFKHCFLKTGVDPGLRGDPPRAMLPTIA